MHKHRPSFWDYLTTPFERYYPDQPRDKICRCKECGKVISIKKDKIKRINTLHNVFVILLLVVLLAVCTIISVLSISNTFVSIRGAFLIAAPIIVIFVLLFDLIFWKITPFDECNCKLPTVKSRVGYSLVTWLSFISYYIFQLLSVLSEKHTNQLPFIIAMIIVLIIYSISMAFSWKLYKDGKPKNVDTGLNYHMFVYDHSIFTIGTAEKDIVEQGILVDDPIKYVKIVLDETLYISDIHWRERVKKDINFVINKRQVEDPRSPKEYGFILTDISNSFSENTTEQEYVDYINETISQNPSKELYPEFKVRMKSK